MRLIDADALMDDIKRDTKKAVDEGDKAGSFWLGYAAGSVIAQPTIQPQSTAGQLNDGARSTDLIDRQQAIDALDCINGTEEVLRSLPPAQPEAQEGEWINTNPEYKNGFYNNSYYCSECHDYYTTSPYEMKFCPNCGVRMKGATP